MVWSLFVSLLLITSVGIADEFSVKPLKAGDCVLVDGNFVTDAYIEAVRKTQIANEAMSQIVKEEPKEGVKKFTDGILWGGIGGVLLTLLFL